MPLKGRQISVRVVGEIDAWLERRAGGSANKADFVRRLIEQEIAREREESLLEVFNKAAAELTESDRGEREALLGAFVGNEEKAGAKGKIRSRRKVAR